MNKAYIRLACQGKKLQDIYRELVKAEYYAMLSQYTYELVPKPLRSNRLRGTPDITDVSAQKLSRPKSVPAPVQKAPPRKRMYIHSIKIIRNI